MRKKKMCWSGVLLLAVFGAAGILAWGSHDQVPSVEFRTRIGATRTTASQNKAKVAESYGKLPLHFEVNKGQMDKQVKFLSRGSGYNLFLTANEAVLSLNSPQSAQRAQREYSKNSSASSATSAVRIKLVGANPQPQVKGLEELPGKVNYFLGNDPKKWRTNVPTYAKVKYEEVYQGIDLVYYGNQRQLEYDFVVSPGADPKAITVGFEGADGLRLDAQGDLIVRVSDGEIRQQKPLIYQEADGERREISGGYALLSDSEDHVSRFTFHVGSYDSRRPLIIDPVLSYSTYLGGSGDDSGNGIALDSAGNVYVTGQTYSTNFPTTTSLPSTNGSTPDAFVMKLNAAGSALVYSTYLGGGIDDVFGGGAGDVGTGIAVDSNGNAYVTGATTSTDFPTVNPIQSMRIGRPAAFVAKLNSTGSALLYSTYLGGSSFFGGETRGFGIAVDSSGNAYVTGGTKSTNFPTVNAFQSSSPDGGGNGDGFVAKLNPSGSALLYSTYLGGFGSVFDRAHSIAVDSSGNIYVTGMTASSSFPTTANAVQPTKSGSGSEAFVTKINPSQPPAQQLVYSTYLGLYGFSIGFGIAADSAGNAYVTGQLRFNPGGFVAKIDTTQAGSASLVYRTFWSLGPGGSGTESGMGIAVDSAGIIYVTGATSISLNNVVDPFQALNGGGYDAFVMKIDPSQPEGQQRIYVTHLGGSGNDYGNAIAIDSAGNAYITGTTVSTNFPIGSALQPISGGSGDVFVTKLSPCACTPAGSNVAVDLGNSIALTFDSVVYSGETTVTTSTTPPTPQSGFDVNGTYYDISTTATFSGFVTVTLPYDPATVPDPFALRLLHYDKTLDTWVDVTQSVDTGNFTITGVVSSFSEFAVGRPVRRFSGFLPPIKKDGSSIFRFGSTVPVKFQLKDDSGAFITNATARIYIAKVSNGIIGTQQEGVSTNAPDAGNTFRYDSANNQYVFNLGTKSLSQGTWHILVTLDDKVSYTVLISLDK